MSTHRSSRLVRRSILGCLTLAAPLFVCSACEAPNASSEVLQHTLVQAVDDGAFFGQARFSVGLGEKPSPLSLAVSRGGLYSDAPLLFHSETSAPTETTVDWSYDRSSVMLQLGTVETDDGWDLEVAGGLGQRTLQIERAGARFVNDHGALVGEITATAPLAPGFGLRTRTYGSTNHLFGCADGAAVQTGGLEAGLIFGRRQEGLQVFIGYGTWSYGSLGGGPDAGPFQDLQVESSGLVLSLELGF
tara:strand:+ start:3129 stop:3866 length:738 start_codon:yes stop_codon:yes gene_type:complete